MNSELILRYGFAGDKQIVQPNNADEIGAFQRVMLKLLAFPFPRICKCTLASQISIFFQ